MAWPATGSYGRPPAFMIGCASGTGRRTNRSSPNSPANMLPFTNAARLPNIGRMVTAGSAGTSLLKAALASSVGLGILGIALLLILAMCSEILAAARPLGEDKHA